MSMNKISTHTCAVMADLSDRDFREVVSELVTVYKKAICTTPHA